MVAAETRVRKEVQLIDTRGLWPAEEIWLGVRDDFRNWLIRAA